MKKFIKMWDFKGLFVTVLGCLFLIGCAEKASEEVMKPEILIYCGITMVKPMSEIAKIIEQRHAIKIVLSQGGSEDLYQSLKTSKQGDLYLPGSASYRQRHIGDGLLGDFVHVGYNQAALMVKKGNPKKISNITDMQRKDINLVICNPESGSIGRETKRILNDLEMYDDILQNTVYLTTDSRNLNGALKKGDADLILNWRATAFFEENKHAMEVIDLDYGIAKPKKLLLNLLTFTQHPQIAREFMEYAASDAGQAIFRKYGFLDNTIQIE